MKTFTVIITPLKLLNLKYKEQSGYVLCLMNFHKLSGFNPPPTYLRSSEISMKRRSLAITIDSITIVKTRQKRTKENFTYVCYLFLICLSHTPSVLKIL